MSLCESIDTLAMAYLDDELAPEERRELETHLTECTACRGEVDGARADQSLIQGSLLGAAPRATDTMRMRLLRSFDQVDREAARIERKRMSAWLLPGGAIAAAAAAILVFVGVGFQRPRERNSIAHVVAHIDDQSSPLITASTNGSTELGMDVPKLQDSSSKLVEQRRVNIDGHRGALIAYDIAHGTGRAVLRVLVLTDLHDGEMADGDETQANGRWVHVGQDQGHPFVTYIDKHRNGYMFTSDAMTADELIDLVGKTKLVGPQ